MLFDYFMHRKMDWDEAEKLTGFGNSKAAWTVTIWERMARMGFDIRMVEAFEYRRYLKFGDEYLRTYFTPEEYAWQLEHTNIQDIPSQIPAFLKSISPDSRRPKLNDIDDMLEEKRLVCVTLNSRVLNGKDGFVGHAILILSKEGDEYIAHDPGGSTVAPQPERRIPSKLLWQAMGGDTSTSEVVGVKLAHRPTRADVLLARLHPEYSRAALAKLFDKGLVTFNDKELKAGDKIMPGSPFTADLSSLQQATEDIELPVVYEDDDCIVINKPAGVLTHVQGEFNPEPTVASFLRQKSRELEGERAGVVHRLDRPTSGIIIGAKNARAMSWLQRQFAERTVSKTYVAVVQGQLQQDEAIIDMPIERNPKAPATFRVGSNGKNAVTRYKVLAQNEQYSLVELKPQTGRTHQLRVHLAKIGHPIVGDPLYGKGSHGDRLYLHARSLQITLPDGELKTFEAPVPPEFAEVMR
jgi:23S rRNA pseudouridine1911/1915/1917 synthase